MDPDFDIWINIVILDEQNISRPYILRNTKKRNNLITRYVLDYQIFRIMYDYASTRASQRCEAL